MSWHQTGRHTISVSPVSFSQYPTLSASIFAYVTSCYPFDFWNVYLVFLSIKSSSSYSILSSKGIKECIISRFLLWFQDGMHGEWDFLETHMHTHTCKMLNINTSMLFHFQSLSFTDTDVIFSVENHLKGRERSGLIPIQRESSWRGIHKMRQTIYLRHRFSIAYSGKLFQRILSNEK